MSSYSLTKARMFQYVGILFALGLIAVGYWYFSVRAGVKTNSSALQPQGVGDLSAGLAGYWKFDDASGTTATDASTNSNNGTLTNGPTWTTGQIGGAVNFDGTNDYISTNTTLTSTDSITLSAWVKGDGSPTMDYPIFGHINGQAGSDHQCLFYDNGGTENLFFGNGVGGSVGVQVSGTGFTLGTNWHHVVYTNQGTKNSIYLDGVRLVETTSNALTSASEQNIEIGRCVTGGGTFYFDGLIDEARIYNRALSAEEITSLYRLTTPTGVDTSLKGYWSFNADALSSTTAYDRSGAGNNGTLTNGPAVDEGRVGQALNFWPNGSDTNARVNVGNVSSLDVTTGDFTLTLWAKTSGYVNQGSGINTFAGKQGISACGAGYHIDYTSTNLPRFYIADSGCTHTALVEHNVNVADNRWHMITGVKSGTNINIAVDGVFTTAVSAATVGSLTNSLPFVISDDGYLDDVRNIQGLIDEVRFYNRALSEAEVKSLYDRSAPDKGNTSALSPGGNGRLESGLAGYWPLDNGSGTTATDASTNGNNGTLTNGPTWATGQIGSAVTFDGTNDYIAVSATPFTGHSSGTITAWIKSTNASAAQTIFGISTLASSNYAGYFHTNSNGKLQMRIKGNGVDLVNCGVTDTGSSSQVAASGTWTFVAITNDATGKKIYKNAYQQGTDCGSDTTWFNALSAQTPVDASVGAWLVAGGAQTLFQGSIDEVRVYDHALSQDEITNLYRVTTPTAVDTGLKGYWSFNGQDMSSTLAYDRSGVGNNGTLNGGLSISEGVAGQALSFDGVDDNVRFLSNGPIITGALSASFWIKTTSAAAKTILGFWQNTGWMVQLNGDGSAPGKISFYSNNSGYKFANSTINDGSWHHVSVTLTGSGVLAIYQDGVLNASYTSIPLPGSYASDKFIGTVPGGGQYFLGSLDEVRLYDRVLTAAEVQSQYEAAKPDKTNTSITQSQGTGRLDSGLAAYWKMDDGSGAIATDSSTNAKNGTLQNGTTWGTGQIGGATSFDGTNDAIDVTNTATSPINIALGDKVSTAFWYKANQPNGTAGTLHGRNNGGCEQHTFNVLGGVSTDTLSFYYRGGNCSGIDNYQITGVSKNVWHHVASTYDTTTGAFVAYLDGVRGTSGTVIPTADISNNASTFYIGGTGGQYLNGFIDEFRIYKRVLSPDEVTQLYRLGAPTGTDTSLKGYWSFNGQDMSGTTAYDRSGAGNNGTLTNGPAITEGKLGQGLSFDGSNDYIDIADTNFTGTFTFSTWFNSSNNTPAGCIFGSTDGGGSGGPKVCIVTDTLFIRINSIPGDSDTTIAAPTINTWHHLAVVRDASDKIDVYLDGAYVKRLFSNAAQSGTYTLDKIGVNGGDSSQPFIGKLDEVRAYNRALTASEVKSLYDTGR